MGSIDTIDWRDWVHAIAINLTGTVYCARKAVSLFKPQRYGKIINLSGGGATNPLPGISAYAASKAASVRFTETLALELKPFGIDVNAVAPGALATRMMDQLLEAKPAAAGSAKPAGARSDIRPSSTISSRWPRIGSNPRRRRQRDVLRERDCEQRGPAGRGSVENATAMIEELEASMRAFSGLLSGLGASFSSSA